MDGYICDYMGRFYEHHIIKCLNIIISIWENFQICKNKSNNKLTNKQIKTLNLENIFYTQKTFKWHSLQG